MKKFIKEWGPFTLLLTVIVLLRLFIFIPVEVDGHSMDPTLAEGDRLIMVTTAKIQRFDIVVADETEEGETKQVVKRVIGMPGDTVSYTNDVLTINGKEVDEAYLDDYKEKFAQDKLQNTYSYNVLFQELAAQAEAFTTDADGQTDFTVQVPEGQYYLLGDDRIVSKDSREVGTFAKSAIAGEVKFRFWPLTNIGIIS
ncbi:signal peptidase I [Streptococcus chenjunshii]|uniref:Signal peptidase I n=1 Tax=Streptococcus chenjunshii TaxID=2173853 RepID=A0A372KPP3_9STRE|nr:signal peptidase I [Streptococcus chenjunshii]AXQ77960.1 signal peptidase I [Streptococcus chenjunshii]RFU51796.1 signal peptidase I [Streptococcus chenjunshii]RFU53884.1 signal peptidase I [Streptococcus chenjunshii]